MLYKEWKSFKFKFYMLLGAFLLLGFQMFVAFHPLNKYEGYTPFYQNWIDFTALVMLLGGIFCGADLVAGETERNTLNFLLTHPIKRTNVYLAKLLLSSGGLLVAFIIPSVPMYFFDQASVHPTNPAEAGFATLTVVLAGLASVCLTSLISIFCQTTIQTILISTLATAIVAFFLILMSNWLRLGIFNDDIIITTIGGNWQGVFAIAALALGFLFTGLSSFSRKQF